MSNLCSYFTYHLIQFFLTFCLHQDLNEVETLQLAPGSHISFNLPISYHLFSSSPWHLVVKKSGHLSWKVLHILDLASRFSFYIFQCRWLARSRGLKRFLFDFGEDSSCLHSVLLSGGTLSRFYLSLSR